LSKIFARFLGHPCIHDIPCNALPLKSGPITSGAILINPGVSDHPGSKGLVNAVYKGAFAVFSKINQWKYQVISGIP
jgi:hypothetical protein